MIESNVIKKIIQIMHKNLNMNKHDFNVKYNFFPLQYIESKEHYSTDVRIYFDKSIPKLRNDALCYFVKKEYITNMFIGNFSVSGYTDNMRFTATNLWKYHDQKTNYYLTWIFAICTQIINEQDKIRLCENKEFYYSVFEIFNYFKFHITPDYPDFERIKYYNTSKRVLPDGALKPNLIHFENNGDIIVSIAKIFVDEILHIMNKNYLCVINPISIK